MVKSPLHSYFPGLFVPTEPFLHLKNRLFALVTRGTLLRIAEALGISGMEQRNTYAIIHAIREHKNADLSLIIGQLSELEQKILARDLGLSSTSRKEYVAALLTYASSSSPNSPQATPTSPPDSLSNSPSIPMMNPATNPTMNSTTEHLGSKLDNNFSLIPPIPRKRRSKQSVSRLPGHSSEPFVAIDFETADYGRDSACAVALVRVENSQIVRRVAYLIRPPRRQFVHSHIHGISWTMVSNQPNFHELWPRLTPLLEGAAYLVAHNAPFDRSVLHACCTAANLPEPTQGFECTVQMAKRLWALPQSNLPFLCQRFGIPLQHHDAASDAEACARLVLVARSQQK